MTYDLLIPFGILLIMVIYFIYSRTKFEKDIVSAYEEKYKEWKKHATTETKKESCKELVGLVFKKDAKIDIEVFDERIKDRLDRGKFNTKVK